jgi:hypothetical protein
MTDDRDIARVLELWLADGPIQMPDRVFDAVGTGIARQRQRPAWRLTWRRYTMNTNVKIAAALATLLVVAVVGYNLLPGTSTGVGGPAATPSPTPSATATPTPPYLPSGFLEAGRYQTNPFQTLPGITATFDAPAGWEGFEGWAILGPDGTDPPAGVGMAFLLPEGAFSDPCHWDALGDGSVTQPGDVAVGPTVEDLVSALRANTAYTTSEPVDISIGGYDGMALDLEQPAGLDPSTCDSDGETGRWIVLSGIDGSLYSQGPGYRWHFKILDVGGIRVVVVVADYAETSAEDRAAVQAIVDSIDFTP